MYRTVLTTADLACLVGFLAITAGIAWALHDLGFGADWLLGVASIAGAATGLVGGAAFVRSQLVGEPGPLAGELTAMSR